MTDKPLPPPCEVHELHPHDHSHVPADYREHHQCSKRFWCPRCSRWLDGEACKPLAVKAA